MMHSGRRRSDGQSLAEFALVLPVLMLIVLIGLDFGRSFLGWVGLNNAARIAANYASLHPDAWSAPANPTKAAYQAEYARLVTNDFQSVGCQAPDPIPTPAFLDGGSTAIGAKVSVSLPCQLPLLTPVISSLFPSGVPITGGAIFTARGGAIAATGGGGGGGLAPVAACSANPLNVVTPNPVTLTNMTTGSVSNWVWDFGDGSVSTAQDPGLYTYTAPGTYVITLNATNTFGTTTATCGSITVTSIGLAGDFTWSPLSPNVGDQIAFSGNASGGSPGYTWSWDFGDGTQTSGSASPTHSYAAAGSFTVKATVQDSAGATVTATHVIAVSKTCPVPTLVGTDTQHAQKTWNDAGFTTNVNFNPGTGKGSHYIIVTQTTSPPSTYGQLLPCGTTQVTVTNQ